MKKKRKMFDGDGTMASNSLSIVEYLVSTTQSEQEAYSMGRSLPIGTSKKTAKTALIAMVLRN